MKGLIFRHYNTGHRFERQTAILLHHLIHLGPCRLRLHRYGRLEETPVQCGLFIAEGMELHDVASGLAVVPDQLPLAYLLPPTGMEEPLLRLTDTAGGWMADLILSRLAWESEVLRHLVETLHPAPVDAETIRSRHTTGSLIQAA
ncbi:hypothetical protein KBB96_02530 [Luteolibacter ambystomatis]|uniref:Uncharacterized protein n=1 Tax=Luteolibacter ambystomatis TaxID=2824561 RepID=A0A975PF17_9BACT|nr:hypothetical protein [Luteolibacter ambystomatis]QUE51774.1 hypothetical protein KBB96_02530 [Luteolibacter ambystomatis]